MRFTKYEKGAYHWRQYEDPNNKYRRHVTRLQSWIEERSVLEVGAGDGLITAVLDIQGIDNEPLAVQLAQEKGANVIYGDAYAIPFPDGSFEAVLMADALEHFEWPVAALNEAKRVLTKSLYVTTPPKRPDGKLTDSFHYQEWAPEELKNLVESVGFKLSGEIQVFPEEKIMYGHFRKT